ncbi:MAG: glycosyltransferase family 1 protein [Alphaproteobacteria bacterium]|nr:glycosyltransferase family 1 protein [Alphaproteobacteria bacterium]
MWRGPGTRRPLAPREVVFAVPGALDAPTGGHAYDRHVAAGLAARGWTVRMLPLSDRFPDPDDAILAESYACLASVPVDRTLLIDGLALGALPEIGARLGRKRPLVALIHHPLALETGAAPGRAAALATSERAALAAAHRVVTTSRTTAAMLAAAYGVPRERLVVAPPGTSPAPPARGSGGEAVALLSVGSLVPRKGHDVLIAALAGLRGLPWRLAIAGEARDRAEADRLRSLITATGLDERVALLGPVDAGRLVALYDRADLFVLASRYEGYGMVYAEALAHGLPVVGTTAGAVPEVVPAGAGVLVPPGDAGALAQVLQDLIGSRRRRAALAAGARLAAVALPRWEATVDRVAGALEAAA